MDKAVWERKASGLEGEAQLETWNCRDTWRQPVPPHPSPLTWGNTSVLIQSPQVPCLMSQLVTESKEGLGTHRGASETSRARGAGLTTVSLGEEEDDDDGGFGEMSQHWGRRGTDGVEGQRWRQQGAWGVEWGDGKQVGEKAEHRSYRGSSVLTGAPRAPVGPAGPLGPVSPCEGETRTLNSPGR